MQSGRWVGPALLVLLLVAGCGGTTASQPGALDAGGHDAQADALFVGDVNTGPTGRDAQGEDAAPVGPDATLVDAPDDAGYLACLSASGQLDGELKTCQSDNDCAIEQEQTDCCGTILYVGVNNASVAKFATCESAWVAHFPGCGCDSNQTKTEDGMSTPLGTDAGGPKVHCADFTMSGGSCLTYTP